MKKGTAFVWNSARLKLLKKMYANNSIETIAARFQVSPSAIRNIAFKVGLKRPDHYWTKAEDKRLLMLWPKMTAKNVSKELTRGYAACLKRYQKLTNNGI